MPRFKPHKTVEQIANMILMKFNTNKSIKWLGKNSVWKGDNLILQADNSRLLQSGYKMMYSNSLDSVAQTINDLYVNHSNF
jgi:hypothetical protein